MCGVILAMIIFVLELFKFPVTLNSFTRLPSNANFIFVTVSYHSLSSSCCRSSAAAGPCPSSSLAATGFSSSSASFYTMSFNLSCCPYPIFSIILSYNKKAVSRMLCSLSASASRAATMGADTALYNFEFVFLKNVFIFYYTFLRKFFQIYGHAKATFELILRSVNSFDVKNNEKMIIEAVH